MLSEIRQSMKQKYCMISLICVILKIKQSGDYGSKQCHRYREEN